jgi:hypothetical protein
VVFSLAVVLRSVFLGSGLLLLAFTFLTTGAFFVALVTVTFFASAVFEILVDFLIDRDTVVAFLIVFVI